MHGATRRAAVDTCTMTSDRSASMGFTPGSHQRTTRQSHRPPMRPPDPARICSPGSRVSQPLSPRMALGNRTADGDASRMTSSSSAHQTARVEVPITTAGRGSARSHDVRPRLAAAGTPEEVADMSTGSGGATSIASAQIDDGRDRAATRRALVECPDGDEHGRIPGCRAHDPADRSLDLAVMVNIGVVEHHLPLPPEPAGGIGLALDEDVDQSAAEIRGLRALGQLESGGTNGLVDPFDVERVVHHAVPGPIAAADLGVAHHDRLRLVEFDAG